MLTIMREALVALHVNPVERSRVLAMLQMTVMLISVPFGYIGGKLSSMSRALPFALNIALLAIGAIATLIFFQKDNNPQTA
jgi:hypothetical protein